MGFKQIGNEKEFITKVSQLPETRFMVDFYCYIVQKENINTQDF